MEGKKSILQCHGISKDFGITKALKNVDLSVYGGEIRGLIGENGSGKSTLTAIIAGIHRPSAGTMTLREKPWEPKSVLHAQENNIGIIVQEAGTIERLTVAENLFLGQETLFRKNGIIDRAAMTKAAQEALDGIGASDIHAAAMTYTLNMQDRKLVEIAKAIRFNPDIFIVDETTTVLSQSGRDILYRLIRKLAAEGKAVLLISHDLDELIEYCDTLTILKDGELIQNMEKSKFDENKIRELMIGREISGSYYRTDKDGYLDEAKLVVDRVTTLGGLTNFSMTLHKGEILGIGGLSQCGMHELGRTVFGLATICSGEVRIDGKIIRNSAEAVKNGIGYTSKDRDKESLALGASIYDNISSTGYQKNLGTAPFISRKKERRYVQEQIDSLRIKCQSERQEVRALSGGNKQKVVFGKWIAKDTDVLVLDCPTRGVDIGVKAEMYRLIYEIKKTGKSILLISEELPELLGMSDRILIMKDGKISAEFDHLRSKNITEKDVIEYII